MPEKLRQGETLAEKFERDWESDKHLYYAAADVDDLSPTDVAKLFLVDIRLSLQTKLSEVWL